MESRPLIAELQKLLEDISKPEGLNISHCLRLPQSLQLRRSHSMTSLLFLICTRSKCGKALTFRSVPRKPMYWIYLVCMRRWMKGSRMLMAGCWCKGCRDTNGHWLVMIYSTRYFELHMVVVSIPYSTSANECIPKLIAVVVKLDISKGIIKNLSRSTH